MPEIGEKILKEYSKNVKIVDIKINSCGAWETVILKVLDNNKKHFKKVTLYRDTFLDFNDNSVKKCINSMLDEYVFLKNKEKIKKVFFDNEIKNIKENILNKI